MLIDCRLSNEGMFGLALGLEVVSRIWEVLMFRCDSLPLM